MICYRYLPFANVAEGSRRREGLWVMGGVGGGVGVKGGMIVGDMP